MIQRSTSSQLITLQITLWLSAVIPGFTAQFNPLQITLWYEVYVTAHYFTNHCDSCDKTVTASCGTKVYVTVHLNTNHSVINKAYVTVHSITINHKIAILLRSGGRVLAGIAGLLWARIPEETGLVSRIANEDHCDYKNQRADGTRFPLQKEASEIEKDKHDMVV